jgi:hypothetical protein
MRHEQPQEAEPVPDDPMIVTLITHDRGAR